MSLKAFHLFFICLSVVVTALFAAWALINGVAPVIGALSGVVSILLVIYAVYFVKKSRHIIT